MKLIHYSAIAATLFLLSSCSKELSLELADPDEVKQEDLKDLMLEKRVQLKAFYSDIPVDYVENDDTVKHETNLWAYVSDYLKDDYNTFKPNGRDVEIEQNTLKIPGNDAPTLYKHYALVKDKTGIHFDFLDYQYHPLRYDLYKVGSGYFILSIKWKHGATLFSRFEVVP